MKNIQIVIGSLSAMVILVLAVVLASFWAFGQIETATEASAHSDSLMKGTQDLLASLVDAETGQRGYALTGNDTFLEPYNSVRDHIKSELDALRHDVKSSEARKPLDAMVPLVTAKMKELAIVIALRRQNNMPAVIERVSNGRGKMLMDEIRVQANAFIALTKAATEKHNAEFRNGMRFLFNVMVATSGLIFLLALAFAFLTRRESQYQIQKIIQLETQHLLEGQEKLNHLLKKANLSLQISEERLAVTLNSIGDAVMAADINGYVTLLNPVAEELTGWKLADALGQPVETIFKIISHETRLPSTVPIKETMSDGKIHSLSNHILLIARDGSERAIADSCAPIHTEDERIVGAVLVFRDVSERMQIDLRLKNAYANMESLTIELKRVARAKSEFLANMSHELRTPLNSINGFSEVLYDETFGPLNDKQKNYVHNVLTSGQHLLALINQILDMTKVEAGKMELSLVQFSTKDLLHEIAMLVSGMANKKKLEIVLSIPEDLPDIEADELKTKEVIYNLLSNAVKFTPEGGKIGIRASHTDKDIEVVIWDKGIGIASENMEKLFEGFFRVDSPLSRSIEGTGLGLPLSKKLVELHGGTFQVESQGLNTGTSVRFSLPIISGKRA